VAIEVITWVWKHSRSKLSARLVLLAIADNANSADGSGAWPSIKELARKANISTTAVHASLHALVELGELRVERNGGKPGPNGITNSYQVIMDGQPPTEPVTPRSNGRPRTGTESAPRTDSEEVPNQNGYRIRTRADSAPLPNPAGGVPIPARRGTDSGPGTVLEPPSTVLTPAADAARRADDRALVLSHLHPVAQSPEPQTRARPDYDMATAQGLVQVWIDNCRNGRPPEPLIGRVSSALKRILEGGSDPLIVRAGLAHWAACEPSRSPQVLASFVHDVQEGKLPGYKDGRVAAAPPPRQSVADIRNGQAAAIKQRLREQGASA
jgi:hypothetical protein